VHLRRRQRPCGRISAFAWRAMSARTRGIKKNKILLLLFFRLHGCTYTLIFFLGGWKCKRGGGGGSRVRMEAFPGPNFQPPYLEK
jgi:hypothetical protein